MYRTIACQCHATYVMNVIWTTYLIHLTMYLGQLYHMHIISKQPSISMSIYKHTYINIHQTTIIKHVITNQVITPFTLKASYGIYIMPRKMVHTSSPKPALERATKLAKQAFKPTSKQAKYALNSLDYYFQSKQSLNTFWDILHTTTKSATNELQNSN